MQSCLIFDQPIDRDERYVPAFEYVHKCPCYARLHLNTDRPNRLESILLALRLMHSAPDQQSLQVSESPQMQRGGPKRLAMQPRRDDNPCERRTSSMETTCENQTKAGRQIST